MAQVKVTAKVIEDPESTAAAEDLIHWSEGGRIFPRLRLIHRS